MSLTRAASRAMGVVAMSLGACTGAPDVPNDRDIGVPAIALDPVVVIGESDGDPAYLFGDIRAVAVDDEGRIYVGDRIGATVRAYSSTGEFIREVATEGQGPGEIDGWPADLALGPDGSLYVRDGSRVTVFARSGSDGIADSVASIWRVPGYGNLTYARSRVGDDGAYYYPNGSFPIGGRPRFFYHVFRGGEATGDTLEVPFHEGMRGQRTAFYPLRGGDGRMVDGLNRVPFAPIPSWDVTHEGTIVSTDGRNAQLLETGLAGDTLRVLTLGADLARPIPPDERDDSLRALEARIDSLPVPLEEVLNLGEGVAERRLPEVLPTVVAVHIAMGGLIWVQRWPSEGAEESGVYDVFDATGVHQASVALLAPLVSEPPPFFGRRAVVGVVRDPGSGVERVVKFSIEDVLGYLP